MGFLNTYIKNIAVFLIFITLIGIISPSSKYKKYINLVLGFILIFVIIAPVSGLLRNTDFNIESLMVRMSYNPATEAESIVTQNELIIDAYEAELKSRLEMLLEDNQLYSIKNSFFEIDSDEESFGMIRKIAIVLSKKSTAKKNNIIRIEKIVISEIEEEGGDTEEIDNMKRVISDFYNLSVENIYITVQKNTEE